MDQESLWTAQKRKRTCENVSSGGKGAAAMSCAAFVVRRRSSSNKSPLQVESSSALWPGRLPHDRFDIRQDLSTFLDHDSQRRRSDLGIENNPRFAQDFSLLWIIGVSCQFCSFSQIRG